MTTFRIPPIVDLDQFKTAFEKAVESFSAELIKNWNSASVYTSVWENKIYGEINAQLLYTSLTPKEHVKIDNKTYQIDAVFYSPAGSIALEHENMSRSSYQEMDKLSMLNDDLYAGLKVLVTYPDQTNHKLSENSLLADYATIIKKHGYNHDFKQMVIFGFKKGKHIDWEYYLFNGKAFAPY